MRGIHDALLRCIVAPLVLFDLHLIFGIDRVHFFVDVGRVKCWGNKKLRKAIQRGGEMFRRDVEEKVGVIASGVGVV